MVRLPVGTQPKQAGAQPLGRYAASATAHHPRTSMRCCHPASTPLFRVRFSRMTATLHLRYALSDRHCGRCALGGSKPPGGVAHAASCP
eukprot:101009-Chlamydomonas_euryale.AAC.3